MRTFNFKPAMFKSALAASVLLLTGGTALAQVNLTAGASPATLPDGTSAPMWGYSCGTPVVGSTASCATLNPTAAAGTWSPVVITVPTGQDLQINLTNSLSFLNGNTVPTSLVIVGQVGGGLGDVSQRTTTASPDHSATQSLTWPIADPTTTAPAPSQGARVQSFSTEVAAGPTPASLTWKAPRPGTYLIESGTHPSIQVPMGLYGIVVVTDASTGTAYPAAGARAAVTYNADLAMLMSEIDPVQNAAVSAAVNTLGFSETAVWSGMAGKCGDPAVHSCYPPAVNYTPTYYLFNGRAFDRTNAGASLYPINPTTVTSGNLLVRLVNAGLRMHVPSIVGATTTTAAATSLQGMTLVAEDGNLVPGSAHVQSEVFMAAGKTYDVMINVPTSATALPIFDRQLSLSANTTARDAGMLAYIGANGGTVPPVASLGAAAVKDDVYNALLAGQTLTISDPSKGVIANDTNVIGVTLQTAPTSGTVTLNANGTFTYVPSGATVVADTFQYCANGSVTAGVCSSGLTATVSLNASNVSDAGITCSAAAFTASVANQIAIKPPGVLAGCTDGAGLALTVQGATATTPVAVGSALVDLNGGFTATGSGTQTFAVTAQNALGLTKTFNVTVAYPAASNLQVTVLDGTDHTTKITDYRWVIEEDRTFFVDPKCTTNPLPASCPVATPSGAPVNYGTNFHTSYMPLVATGCTGPLSCEYGQTVQGQGVVCDVGNGVCRSGSQQTQTDPSQVALDPAKRYYISILPGDAANPFMGGNLSAPTNCSAGALLNPTDPTSVNTACGHGMGGAPIPAGATAVTILTVPTPLPTATMSVFVYEDDWPLNGEQGAGGGVDVLATNEPGLGSFQVTIFDQAGGTGDATGQPTYDMFNQPLSNSLAGTIDPVTGLDACPISNVVSSNVLNGPGDQQGVVGMIVTCPKFESDGRTLSPMAGQAVIKNLYPGRYGVSALPGADRIALGEEWVQTNTLDGQKSHDSFMRIGEPGYFQEFGPAGYHVSIGFANPKIINDRRFNSSHSGMCDPAPSSANSNAAGGGLACNWEVKGKVTGSRLSRTPDQRLYSSGSRDALAFTQCYISLGDPDGAEIAFTKCDADGNFDFQGIPPGNWKITTFDQWNDQIIDGITQGVGVGCSGTISGLCGSTSMATTCTGASSSGTTCDMGEIGVHQWQADIYTRSFIDTDYTGVSTDAKPGLALVATNIRFRDGSYSNFNNTDLTGAAGFNEVFPLFNWYVVETDSTRYKSTGTHVIYDAGGPADGSASCVSSNRPCGQSSTAAFFANTYELYPLPPELMVAGSVPCANADCINGETIASSATRAALPTSVPNSTGRIDPPTAFGSYGWQGYIGQGNFLEFGKRPFATGETGPIHGHVIYASTRPFDDPQLLLQLSWEPMVPHVRVNLYKEGVAADGVTPTLTLVDFTQTSSFDDWAQGFRTDANGNPMITNGVGIPNISCPGQTNVTDPANLGDPFFYALQDQPSYLDVYNQEHATPGALNLNPTTTKLPYRSQFKCYDGMHSWNQLQPAPYDGMYSFPSVTAVDPVTGKPTKSNCTGCVTNPTVDTGSATNPNYDPFRAGTPMLPPGKYVVEVVVPPGYELVKEEDKNILIGDNYIAPSTVQFPGLGGSIYILPDQAAIGAEYNATNAQNSTQNLGRIPTLVSHEGDTGSDESFWPCVGTVRQVPDYISLFPQSAEVSPFAGAMRPLCDRKEVNLTEQASALVKFYIFTSTHVASHFQGIILDDFTGEFDPFSPQFGEKFAPSYLPVGIKDWTGNEIGRVYSDQFGLYNGLNYSTWEVNPPNPTGYGPTMMTMCMNDAGMGTTPDGKPDPLFQPGYSQFCYELPFMPGQTGYFDTPVVPVQAFSEGYNHPDCAYPDATPAVSTVTGDVAGPWVSGAGHTLTVTALGNQSVDWYGYTGPSIAVSPWNQQKVTRHYGFGTTKGTVKIGNVTVDPNTVSWSDGTISFPAPTGVSACGGVQQQALYGGSTASCGQLVITTSTGKQSVDTVTVTIGGKTPTVLAAGQTIQSAIDAANPGDMIIVPSGTYNEMLVMWKPVRLQGVGAASSVVDANTQPSGKLLTPWRQKVVCLFGLTVDGRPDTTSNPNGRACVSGLTGATNSDTSTNFMNFPAMVVDRVPFEAVLGWDASLNGNLAEQLSEPSLLGAYEGAAITVLGKGVKYPKSTPALAIADAFGATTGAAFPTGTTLLGAGSDCLVTKSGVSTNPYPTNFYCNPSSIDGLGIRDSSQGGGGIFVHAYAHNLQIANNRVHNNTGTMSGGITIGVGEHPDVELAGSAAVLTYPESCEVGLAGNVTNQSLPFCFNKSINVHNNAVVGNSSMGDELFSSTPAGAGGVSINTGADYYQFTNNWVCGNISTGDGGGFAHIGFIKNGDIEHNTIIFNQSTNPTIATNGGGMLVMGAPDADPTTCGVTTDQDCVPAPNTISPSDGTGPGLKINANLILGNAADSGSGGGLRMQHVNGTDVVNLPYVTRGLSKVAACTADLGLAGGNGSYCYWNSVNLTNNIIANNVAGWDGAGISLLDSLAVNIVNNTIASNDSTASSGTLFQSLFAPLASSAAPTSRVICSATNGQSCPQPAGVVSVENSPVLAANTPTSLGVICPAGHGLSGACLGHSIPLMFNDAIWKNRSFYIGDGGAGTSASGGNQQHTVTLFNADGSTPGSQTSTGFCPAGSSYWEIGYRGETAAGAFNTQRTTDGFVPSSSMLSANYGGSNNLSSDPSFKSQYCNGSRVPPEQGGMGYATTPGTNETNAFPQLVFSLAPSAVVDEGNNWVNLRWGPLSLNAVDTTGTSASFTGAVLGDYSPSSASPAIGAGAASVSAVPHPSTDFYGATRPTGNDTIGAVEVVAPANLIVTCGTGAGTSTTPCGGLTFPSTSVGATSASQQLTLRNTGGGQATGIALTFSGPFSRPSSGGSCGTTLAANSNCTINVVFTPTTAGGASGNVAIAASVTVAGSPVALSGTGVAAVLSASVSPNPLAFGNWATNTTSNSMTLTVTNTGNTALAGGTFTLGGGTPQPFSRPTGGAGGTCGATLAVGANCSINVRFAPAATGAFSRTLTVAYTGATVTPASVTLTGTGVATRATISISPNPLTITDAAGVLSNNGTVTLRNTAAAGSSSVAVTNVAVNGAGANTSGAWIFTKGTDNCTGVNLAPQQTCTVAVNFSRIGAVGTHAGTVVFTDTATGSPQTGNLSGIAQ
jgi:hypothetical protein